MPKRIEKIILVLVIILAIIVIFIYNGIITKQEMIAAKWAQVESQLRSRSGLIYSLVNTAQAHGLHEENILGNIIDARSKWAKAGTIDEKVSAARQMDTAVSQLILVVENYPDLKANGAFLALMDELSGAENRIAVERMRFNEAVRKYDIAVRTFPGSVFSKIFGFKPEKEYFSAQEKAKVVP